MTKKKFYQQGDVLFQPITKEEWDELQKKGSLKQRKDGVLFEGEATGHIHRSIEGDVFLGENGELILRAPKGDTIIHEEHKKVKLPKGLYKVWKVREYDHFQQRSRSVMD